MAQRDNADNRNEGGRCGPREPTAMRHVGNMPDRNCIECRRRGCCLIARDEAQDGTTFGTIRKVRHHSQPLALDQRVLGKGRYYIGIGVIASWRKRRQFPPKRIGFRVLQSIPSIP